MAVKLFGGADPRCQVLLEALTEVLYERGEGIPVPSIIGVIELLKVQLIKNSE